MGLVVEVEVEVSSVDVVEVVLIVLVGIVLVLGVDLIEEEDGRIMVGSSVMIVG